MTRHIGISVPHRKVDDDDDIQEYKRPWVGLTQVELELLCDEWRIIYGAYVEEFAKDIEKKIKEKNGA